MTPGYRSLPPDSGPLTALELLRWIRDPCKLMDDSRARHGEAFTLRIPRMPVVILASPEAARDVFALGADAAHAGKANALLKPFLGAHSLLLLDGAEHLRQRKMILPAFHGQRMQAYGRAMLDIAHAAIDRFPVGRPFRIQPPLQSIALWVILRNVFGLEAGPLFGELADTLTRAIDVSAWPLLLPFLQRDLGRLSPWGRYLRFAGRASEILRAEIRRGRRLGTEGRTDVLAMILDARDESGAPLGEDEVHDELLTLLAAGHETTATALAWALRWILPSEALVRELRDELASTNDDPVRIVKLELLDCTVKEALRLQPVFPIVSRVLLEPGRFGGLELPAGARVAPSPYLVHRHPALYPEPESFRPRRFSTFKPAPWEWLPFGGGLRKCIGATLAIYEMKMVLAALLGRVDMQLATEHVEAVRRGLTLAPSGGLPVIIERKRARTSTLDSSGGV